MAVRIACLMHQGHAGSGVFEEVATARGAAVNHLRLDLSGVPQDGDEYDAAIVLGGSMHATEEERYSWLRPEIQLIRRWVDDDRPVLGICLGAQLLCRAIGGAVRSASRPEIGWHAVGIDDADDALVGHLPTEFTALQWHSYETLPPASAAILGRSDVCVQAFRAGERAWGLQFHPETAREDLEFWIRNYGRDPDAVSVGFDPEAALDAMDEHIDTWNEIGRSIAARFLDVVERTARERANGWHNWQTKDLEGLR